MILMENHPAYTENVFTYEKFYGEDIVEHKTLFYTVIQKNPGTANESIEIAK